MAKFFSNIATCIMILPIFLAGCASLPDYAEKDNTDLKIVTQSRNLKVLVNPNFRIDNYDGLILRSVSLKNEDEALEATEIEEFENLRLTFEQDLGGKLKGSTEKGLYVDITIKDVDPVSPALNVISAIALFVPLDSGGLTILADFKTSDGMLVARRIERISGSITDISNGFSSLGRLNLALKEWSESCGDEWKSCVVESASSES